jgi:hypothetical protein
MVVTLSVGMRGIVALSAIASLAFLSSPAHAGGGGSGAIVDVVVPYGWLSYTPPSPSSGGTNGMMWQYGSTEPRWSGGAPSTSSASGLAPFRLQCEGSSIPSSITATGTLIYTASATGQGGWGKSTAIFRSFTGSASASMPNHSVDIHSVFFNLAFDLDSSQGGDFTLGVSASGGNSYQLAGN